MSAPIAASIALTVTTTTTTTNAPAPNTLLGSAFLLGAAVCWGFGFYAQRVSIEHVTPLWATALRFVIAAPIALAALAWRRRLGKRVPWKAGAVLGVLLYVAFALQTVAMLHTPVSRVALITGLYAVFVPLFQPLFGLKRPSLAQLVGVVVAVMALVLLCGVVGDQQALAVRPNIGDAYTLVMAVVSAVLVLLIGRLAPTEDAVSLNVVQILSMCACSIFFAPLIEGPPPSSLDATTLWSLLYLAVFSTFAAFLFQMLGQQHVSPATASVLMLLETPIGVIAAVLILDEHMAGAQWVGAALAVVAVAIAVVAERRA